MNFQTILLVIGFFITVILSLIIIPILKKVKVGQIERDDGPSTHLKKQGTPTMGGIIFILGISICTIGTGVYYKMQGNIREIANLIPILCLAIGFGIVGFIDDFKKLVLHNTKGLSPKLKMFGLLLISVLYVLFVINYTDHGTSIIIPILKTSITLPTIVYIPFSIFVILATTNAVNLTDGVDGLSSSVCAIIITTLTVIGMLGSVNEVTILGSISVRSYFRFFNVQSPPSENNDGRYGLTFFRRINIYLSIIFKNATNINNNCINPSN